MISQTFPSTRPKYPNYLNNNNIHYPNTHRTPLAVVQPSGTSDTSYLAMSKFRAEKCGITTGEWQRRDEIVKDLISKCSFRIGDTCYPPSKEEYEKMGKCLIVGRILSYIEIDHNNDWPPNDNPMLLSIVEQKDELRDQIINCTTNWPKRYEPQ